ncbi:glycosyl transferase [Flavobacterium sp. GSB-24]|nr:glycosyl transferase [Flavobacterium sp. GSB-24]
MKMPPLVSVVMITYGQENYIRKAVESILMQKCDFAVEFVLANDCSPDGTHHVIEDIIKNHPNGSWIKYFRHEHNLGMMSNFIFALKQCSGSYIAMCEGDDYWTDPLKLQKQVSFLDANPEYVLCFHQVDLLNLNGDIVDDFITKVPEDYETIETLASLGNYIHTPSVVFRNIIRKFPFEFELSPIGDYFLYLMLAEHGKLKFLQEKMAVYRHGVGVFSSTSEIAITKNNLKLFTCLLSYLNNEETKKIILKRHFKILSYLEESIHNNYSNSFVSNHSFFRFLKIIRSDYKSPKKIARTILNNLLKR